MKSSVKTFAICLFFSLFIIPVQAAELSIDLQDKISHLSDQDKIQVIIKLTEEISPAKFKKEIQAKFIISLKWKER